MIMKDLYEEEKPLNLSLAIMADPAVEKIHRKRKRKVHAFKLPLNNVPSSYYEGCEGKIFKLLQLREEMLKLDHPTRKGAVIEDGKGLHLIHLLLITATSVDENNVNSGLDNLTQLYWTVSLTEPTVEEELLAFTCLYRMSPYYQFAHFTANQAIIEAFEKEEDVNNRALHVIDFDVSYGFQWPSLIQSLFEKATTGNRISLRLTGFATGLAQLQETESRLVSFAKGFRNLVFEFQGLLRGSKPINLRKKNKTVAVNLVFHLNILNKSTKVSETLKSVNSLRLSIVVLVEQEGSGSPRSFILRFMGSLHYFAAMFDSLDDCLPLESAERLSVEKKYIRKEIKSVIKRMRKTVNRVRDMKRWKHGKAGWKAMGLKG
ncbi:esterase/lipase/thioesterase family protein [Hibiscus syriacus]|uniref:Esterase/lipase/thioesterase family protein n=1 Tax=Hibiscus syriacus TaxID=106335 RepID=A0A6A2YXY8_HIBSY|nr:esterase/lipase/thioesterase family protein [Hibiscus syriacus]